MAQAVSETKRLQLQLPKPEDTKLTLEEEIFSLHALQPHILRQLRETFAESVVDSATKVLGESTGEAFIRCIGDEKLRDPEEVYASLDSFLHGGSEEMKHAIVATFTAKVHALYNLTREMANQAASI